MPKSTKILDRCIIHRWDAIPCYYNDKYYHQYFLKICGTHYPNGSERVKRINQSICITFGVTKTSWKCIAYLYRQHRYFYVEKMLGVLKWRQIEENRDYSKISEFSENAKCKFCVEDMPAYDISGQRELLVWGHEWVKFEETVVIFSEGNRMLMSKNNLIYFSSRKNTQIWKST